METKMTKTNKRRRALLLIGVPVAALVLAAGAFGAMRMSPPPADLDYARTQTSEKGLFTATIEPGADPIAVNQMHTWTVAVAMADGSAVDPASVTVDGGMPQHGHGLPTAPQVTADLGEGRFAVEGMKFNMGGWWVVNVHVETAQGADVATFNLNL
jgi:hypothetical protein